MATIIDNEKDFIRNFTSVMLNINRDDRTLSKADKRKYSLGVCENLEYFQHCIERYGDDILDKPKDMTRVEYFMANKY